jgi:hypothetical protein
MGRPGCAAIEVDRLQHPDPAVGFGLRGTRAIALATAASVVAFAAGYAVLLQNFFAVFRPPTGMANRVHVAAALGIAGSILAGLALLDTWWKGRALVGLIALVAAVCGMGACIVTSIGLLWADASRLQRAVSADLLAVLPDLPDGSSVLLYGMCPYRGPGPVFSSNFDLSGYLQLVRHQPSIRADVTTQDSSFGPGGVTNVEYGEPTSYPYGNLHIFDAAKRDITRIADADGAAAYFATHPIAASTPCSFTDGGGETLF